MQPKGCKEDGVDTHDLGEAQWIAVVCNSGEIRRREIKRSRENELEDGNRRARVRMMAATYAMQSGSEELNRIRTVSASRRIRSSNS